MNPLAMLGAAGIWLALPFTGEILFERLQIGTGQLKMSSFAQIALFILGGIVIWSLPMALAAGFGVFNPILFGCLGWTVVSWRVLRLTRRTQSRSMGFAGFSWQDWSIAILLVVVGYFYFAYPRETIVGGRDMGVYANHGIYIANHGRLDVEFPWKDTDGTLLSRAYENIPGFYNNGSSWTVQFAHLLPIWLAQSYATFGFTGLIRFNCFVALLFIPIFFELARSFLPISFAFAAACLVAFNPGQIWLARVTLSEILTQVFIWGSVLCFQTALQEKRKSLAYAAGLFLGVVLLIRVDTFLLVPILLISHALYLLISVESVDEGMPIWLAFYRTALPMFLFAAVYDVIFSTRYIIDLAGQLGGINYLMIASAIFLFTVQRWRMVIQKTLSRRWIFMMLITIVVGIALYAYFIRPRIEPYAIIKVAGNLPDNGLNNTRDFREDSLTNLRNYVSPIILLLGLSGLVLTLGRMLRRHEQSHVSFVVILFLFFSGLYLWNPSIAPDQFWWVRRFIPVVIPGVILLSGIGTFWLVSLVPHRIGVGIYVGLLIYLSVFMVEVDAFLLTKSENKGYFDQLSLLAKKLPTDEPILSDDASPWATWETPLFLAFDRNIIPVNTYSASAMQSVRKWIRKKTSDGEKVCVIYEGTNQLRGFTVGSQDVQALSRDFMRPTIARLPDSMMTEEHQLHVYNISRLSDNYLNMNIGTERILGVVESGFFDREQSGVDARRWTNGSASIIVPVEGSRKPEALRIELESTGPKGTELAIAMNGASLYHGVVKAGAWTNIFSLKGVPLQGDAEISISSNTFVPSQSGLGSDTRTLGVAVADIRLMDSSQLPSAKPLPAKGCASLLSVRTTKVIDRTSLKTTDIVSISVANLSPNTWPSVVDLPNENGAVRLGIRWIALQPNRRDVGEQRVDFPQTLYPGDHVRVTTTLNPVDPRGKLFPPGKYELWIGLLQEGFDWFYEKGDTVIKQNMYIR